MTGDEALRILNKLTEIHNFLMRDCDRSAFFHMGVLTEELAMIVRISETSLRQEVHIHEERE